MKTRFPLLQFSESLNKADASPSAVRLYLHYTRRILGILFAEAVVPMPAPMSPPPDPVYYPWADVTPDEWAAAREAVRHAIPALQHAPAATAWRSFRTWLAGQGVNVPDLWERTTRKNRARNATPETRPGAVPPPPEEIPSIVLDAARAILDATQHGIEWLAGLTWGEVSWGDFTCQIKPFNEPGTTYLAETHLLTVLWRWSVPPEESGYPGERPVFAATKGGMDPITKGVFYRLTRKNKEATETKGSTDVNSSTEFWG